MEVTLYTVRQQKRSQQEKSASRIISCRMVNMP